MSIEQNAFRFKPGDFYNFIATRSFALGNTGLNLSEGMDILFDGTTSEFGGQRFTTPQLRGALKAGWLVFAENYDPDADLGPAPSANIQVRSANDLGQNPMQPAKKGAITTVESDERVVMSRGERTSAANQRTQDVRAQQHRGGGARAFNGSNANVETGGAEFGVPVARAFATPAKMVTEVTPNSVGQAIITADKVKVQPGVGMSESEMLNRMTEDERAVYLSEKESRKGDVMSRTVDYVPPVAQTTNLAAYNQNGSQRQAAQPGRAAPQPVRTTQQPVRSTQQPAQQPAPRAPTQAMNPTRSVVGKVNNPHQVVNTEGMNISQSIGSGTEIADPTGMGGQAQTSHVEAEGMRFTNTNGPKRGFNATPIVQPVKVEPQHMDRLVQGQLSQEEAPPPPVPRIEQDGTAMARRSIAKALCKDFPDDYAFGDHWKRRSAMIRLNYESRYDIIRAIFAAESDDMKTHLLVEFPEAFAS